MDNFILSRRELLVEAVPLTAVGGMILNPDGEAIGDKTGNEEGTDAFFKLFPVGKVEIIKASVRIRIFDRYADALLGLDGWSHINVLYWFDKNDVPPKRRILRVHPRGNKENPLTGVFACRAPVRPNLLALSVCKILSVERNLVNVDKIDAFDETPVLDLKPYIPSDRPIKEVRIPDWAKRLRDG
jgi:tRNA-Thr(GGU) m(6)t(6)A37 methyltransferase TsaA